MTHAQPASLTRPAASGREVELKLRLHTQDLPILRARLERLGPSRTGHVDSIYYDTPDLRLAAAHTALRLRCIQRGRRRQWVQTFKTENTTAALSDRGEWETTAPGGRIDPARLAHTPLAQLLGRTDPKDRARAPQSLEPVFRTVFDRTAWDLQVHGARIEAVIDLGQIQAHGRAEPIQEVELELLSGAPTDLFDLALELAGAEPAGQRAADLSLLPYGESKAARGYRLVQDQDPAQPRPGLVRGRTFAVREGGVEFAPGQPLAVAARQWLGQGLGALLANAFGACGSDHPEFVHQARVALRLMRVGLELLAPAADLAPGQVHALQSWTKEFGIVREWDVLCIQSLPSLRNGAGKGAAGRWGRVQAAAARHLERARAALRCRLEAPEFAEFALRLLRWSASEPKVGGQRLDEFVRKALRQRRRKLAKAARSFSGASLARQHKIRIQARDLRYAVETLHAVVPRLVRNAELRTLGRFQDAAGCARDLALARLTLGRLTRSPVLLRQIDEWTREQRRVGLKEAKRLAVELQDW